MLFEISGSQGFWAQLLGACHYAWVSTYSEDSCLWSYEFIKS